MSGFWHDPGTPGRHFVADPLGHAIHARARVPETVRRGDPHGFGAESSWTCSTCGTALPLNQAVPMDGDRSFCVDCAAQQILARQIAGGRLRRILHLGSAWSLEVCSCPPCADKAVADGRRHLVHDATRARAKWN